MTLVSYTHSRAFGCYNVPISMQSAYLKSFCKSKGLRFALPLTEYCIKGCYSALLGRLHSLHALGDESESVTVVATSIYIFAEVAKSGNVYSMLSRDNIMIVGVLEAFQGSIARCLEELGRLNEYNAIVASDIPKL